MLCYVIVWHMSYLMLAGLSVHICLSAALSRLVCAIWTTTPLFVFYLAFDAR